MLSNQVDCKIGIGCVLKIGRSGYRFGAVLVFGMADDRLDGSAPFDMRVDAALTVRG